MADWGPFGLNGKRAIVTGGGAGIGFGIAQRFLEAGARVLIADLDGAVAESAAAQLGGGEEVAWMQADVAEDGAGEAIAQAAVEAFGGVDVLVSNAGIFPPRPMLEMTYEEFDRIFAVNVRGLAFCAQAAALRMIDQGAGGAIVNLASTDSFHPSAPEFTAYGASKGAVLMFTRAFALELAPHRIRVNAVAPGGAIFTAGNRRIAAARGLNPEQALERRERMAQRVPLGRGGEPDDFAKVAVFLASSAADFMTGEVVLVDGGRLLI